MIIDIIRSTNICVSGYRDVISWHVTATCCELQPCRSSNVPKTRVVGLLQPLPDDSVKWRHFRVISGHVRSRDVISCHVTATTCELHHCRSLNAPKTRVVGLLQPPPYNFRSNDVTSGSFPGTWGHVTSFPVTWLPPPASYSPVGANVRETCVFHILQSLPIDIRPNDITSGSLPVKWGHGGHFLSRDCHLLRVTAL